MLNQNLLLTGDDGYNLTKSLRFRSSASAYMTWLPTAAGNRKTWTFSFWMKAGDLATDNQTIFSTSQNYDRIGFQTDNDSIEWVIILGSSSANIATSQVFRDPASWYHIVVAVDTTQATSTNRIKIYVNGSQVTAFVSTTYPSQNYDTGFGTSAYTQAIGRRQSTSNLYFDGYLAETNFIDGQALTPSSFGSKNALTGVWQPAKYTGTYGTNGFYLPFTNTTSTTTLGYDFSGNSNNWTTNNISLTAGTTYDSMVDVPTMSALASNYATLNPLMFRLSNTPAATLSNGNLTSTHTPSAYGTYVFSTIAGYGNKFYYEAVVTTLIGGVSIGIDGGLGVNSSEAARVVYQNTGGKRVNGSASSYGSSYTTGDVIGVAIDLIAGSITFYKNGTSQGVASSSIGTNPYFSYGESDTGNVIQWNFGQRPFSYTPPTGFVALNTFNLPEPSIKAGNKHFNAITYSGTSSAQSITGVGFQPDLVWGKNRTSINGHRLTDVIRGVGKVLFTDTTNGDTTGDGQLSSFNSDGFSLTGGAGAFEGLNESGKSYASWNWKAGNSAGSSNTAGSITSTVSANPTAGFSIVAYTGTGSAATVGHGLGVAPSMIIAKKRSSTGSWQVYHSAISGMAGGYLTLNGTSGFTGGNSTIWNNTAPTSSVFSLGTDTDANANGATTVAYCFAEVAGYSKFGSYTGNGSTDGTFVHLGFRPKFILTKRTNTSGDWFIWDTVRNTYNAANLTIWPNYSSAEYDYGGVWDILSNGFKARTNSVIANNSGDTYIYMAFAENPFKYSLAR